ncbi:MAG: tetraacyldisaccharide 4'-kinase [Bacteroidia bacterium]|nr:tetraacyldisaccharide 4'-kinase [Bacteroidia bacterium]
MGVARGILLRPISWIYGLVVSIVDLLHRIGILKTKEAPIRTICIGNLTVGGTGKTPITEYLIDKLHAKGKKVVMLSRGYRRKTKGLQVATPKSTALDIGDEPMQIHRRYPDVPIVVDGDRNRALEYIKQNMPDTDIVIMDDGMQHKSTKATEYVMVCDYARPIYEDLMLPAGNLREPWSARKRAKTVIVNKCPLDISEEEMTEIERRLELDETQKLYFTGIEYKELVGGTAAINKAVAIAGIGRPEPFFEEIRRRFGEDTECIKYGDHHQFSDEELREVEKRLDMLGEESVLICTEKDAQRLSNKIGRHSVCYLRIGLRLLRGNSFDIVEI